MLRGARPHLQAQLTATWQGHNPADELIATLGSSLAWESDLVHEAPGATPVWLESGSVGNVNSSVDYWHDRFVEWLANPALALQAPTALNQICQHSHAIGDLAARVWDYEFGNDEKWLERIDQQVNPEGPGWMIVMLGSLHTTMADDRTLWRHLAQQGRPKRRL